MAGMPGRQPKPVDNPELAELFEMLAGAGVPDDVLVSLRSAASPEEAVERLVGMGVLPAPEDSFAGLLDHWTPLLRRGCGQVEAELAGSVFVGMVGAAAPDPAQAPEVLAGMIEQAVVHGGPEALAMLRALSVVAPPDQRAAAAEGARKLADGGLKDRPWAKGLGAPVVDACFGYGDERGAQEALAVAFSYGREPHGLVVLIDHDLGGGVKDCFVTDDPDTIRDEYQATAAFNGLDFRDYEPAEAGAILERALSRPACPEQPDQVEDVRDTIALLRQRTGLLSTGGAVRPPARRTGSAPGKAKVHRLKITLRGFQPPIWRRIEVPSDVSLRELHEVIQTAFDWEHAHMWVFGTRSGDYGIPDPELGYRSAASKRLADVARRTGSKFRYTYDFGDDWEHEILVEAVGEPEPGAAYPRCVAGRRAAPPEDCGGVWGYANLLDVLADPEHDEHHDMLDWLGLESADQFDPAAVDLDGINEALSPARGRARG
jgi:hypothetical protein